MRLNKILDFKVALMLLISILSFCIRDSWLSNDPKIFGIRLYTILDDLMWSSIFASFILIIDNYYSARRIKK